MRYLASLVCNDRRTTVVGNTVTKIAFDCKVDRSNLSGDIVKSLEYFSPHPHQVRSGDLAY